MLEDFKFGKISLTDFIILFLPNFIINFIFLQFLILMLFTLNIFFVTFMQVIFAQENNVC